MKKYGQRCSLARALDVVGERWSLLVIRELSLGPRRYSDLRDGLPGIPTNLLAGRLKELQAAGVVTRRTLPPPAAVAVYELTDAGRALRPAISALRDWGRRYGASPSDDDHVRPGWALLNAVGRATTLPKGRICELQIGAEIFYVGANDDTGLSITAGPATAPNASIAMPADAMYALMMASGSDPVIEGAQIDGDPAIARSVLDTLQGALLDTQPSEIPTTQ